MNSRKISSFSQGRGKTGSFIIAIQGSVNNEVSVFFTTNCESGKMYCICIFIVQRSVNRKVSLLQTKKSVNRVVSRLQAKKSVNRVVSLLQAKKSVNREVSLLQARSGHSKESFTFELAVSEQTEPFLSIVCKYLHFQHITVNNVFYFLKRYA